MCLVILFRNILIVLEESTTFLFLKFRRYRDGSGYQNRWIFRKKNKRPLTPPPSFSENYVALFWRTSEQIPIKRFKICNKNFRLKLTPPPLWKVFQKVICVGRWKQYLKKAQWLASPLPPNDKIYYEVEKVFLTIFFMAEVRGTMSPRGRLG